jgi:hypothetical protein
MLDTESRQQSPNAPSPGAWRGLSEAVREYDPDVVVLVARKMPRLVEALHLNLGSNAICISDQATPFAHRILRGARVAVVDDVWNVGTTMLRAKRRVELAGPRSVRLFALGAKDAAGAKAAGVRLTIGQTLSDERYRSIVESVPSSLRLMPKPYDVDFPIVPCTLRVPFRSWDTCWQWLTSQFGIRAHKTVNDAQLAAGTPRATVDFSMGNAWTVKARLYFDFIGGSCNLVPIAIAPSLPLENVYPQGSLARRVFGILESCLNDGCAEKLDESIVREALGRANTFCDSLLLMQRVADSLKGVVGRDSLVPFSLADFVVQFGSNAAARCEHLLETDHRPVRNTELERLMASRQRRTALNSNCLIANNRITNRAKGLLQEGSHASAFDALFRDLGRVVGADCPGNYSLERPYTRAEVQDNPYIRLRLGFTYQELVQFFRNNLTEGQAPNADTIVSALLDLFIDRGAVVPTFTLHGDQCLRVYRRGEANPNWEEAIDRLKLALNALPPEERKELLDSRTRVTKIAAILAFAGDRTLNAGALERGTVGMLPGSVVERHAEELTRVLQHRGLWK